MKSKKLLLIPVIFLAYMWIFSYRDKAMREFDPYDQPKSKSEVLKPIKSTHDPRVQVPIKKAQKPSKKAEETIPVAAKKTNKTLPPNEVNFKFTKSRYAVAFGDVIVGRARPEDKRASGTFAPKKNKLWETNEIAFAIDKNIKNTKPIMDAVEYFNQNTVMNFYPYDGSQEEIIYFVPDEEQCASYLGKVGGHQRVLIAPKCGSQEVMHEIMHVLGFMHEQSRADRDENLEILWDNIAPGQTLNFEKIPQQWVHEYVGSVFYFNFESIMLYPDVAFAKSPGLKTMKSKTQDEISPVKTGLSTIDIERIKYLYN